MLYVLIRIASTEYTIFNIKEKITLIYPKTAAVGFCSKGLKNEFETAVVNELSVFEPLKFYCIFKTERALEPMSCVCKGNALLSIYGKYEENRSEPGKWSQ